MINNYIIKLIKDKKTSYIFFILTILFIYFNLNNKLEIFNLIIRNKIVKLLLILFIMYIGYYNINLGIILFINFIFILNKNNIEGFNSFPNLIDKNEVLKYDKYIKKNDKEETNDEKEEKYTLNKKKSENESDINEIKTKKGEVKIDTDLRKEKLLEELKEIALRESKEKEETIETDLDDKYNTKKRNLDLLKNESDDEVSSSESSSSGSTSSSSSSNSEKEYEAVSMDKARKHVLGKIRNKIKKKYVKNEKI